MTGIGLCRNGRLRCAKGDMESIRRCMGHLLRNAGLNEPFHMKEFAHSQGQFKSWARSRPLPDATEGG
jgi:hypothetical protein